MSAKFKKFKNIIKYPKYLLKLFYFHLRNKRGTKLKILNNVTDHAAFKAGIWYVISNVMVKTVTVITTPIFTRLMTTEEYGTVQTFISWYTVLLPLFSLNLTYSIGRAKLDFPDNLKEYIGSMQVLSIIFSVIVSSFLIIFIQPVSVIFELNIPNIILLIFYLCFVPTIQFWQNGYRYEYQYKQNIIISWYTILTSTILSLILIFTLDESKSFLRILGITIPMIVLSIYFWMKSIRYRYLNKIIEYWRYGLILSVPLILHTISLNILSQSDRIFITKMCGESDTGVYSLAYTYGMLLNVFISAISDGWLPWFHDTYFAKKYDEIRKNIKPLVIFGCYIGLACIAFAPEAILILGGEEYKRGILCVPPIALGIICQYIYTHYVNIELHLKKTKYISSGTVLAAVLNIFLNGLFIPRFGFIAAAYTTLVGYVALMIFHFIISRKILHVKLYNDIFMFAALGITSVVAGILVLLYEKNIQRYFVIFVGFVTFLLYFKNFIPINRDKKM